MSRTEQLDARDKSSAQDTGRHSIAQSNEEMKAFQHLFKSTAPHKAKILDFGTAENLYGKELLAAKPIKKGASADHLADLAAKLGKAHPRQWHDSQDGPGKCNLYLDSVLRAGRIELPWTADEIPSVHNMRLKLEADKAHFDTYHFDAGNSKKDIAQLAPGDIVIWDQVNHTRGKDYPVQHCGIMGKNGIIHFAGSRYTNGYEARPLVDFTRSDLYGLPLSIIRPKHLKYE